MKNIQSILDEFEKRFSLEWWKGFGTTDDIDRQGIKGIKSFITSSIKSLLEEIKNLIVEEMLIAQKEGTPTSRLTSLSKKLDLIIK